MSLPTPFGPTITAIRVEHVRAPNGDGPLAICRVVLDDVFVVRDYFIVQEEGQISVRPPDRQFQSTCGTCKMHNNVLSTYCTGCKTLMPKITIPEGEKIRGNPRLFSPICAAITPEFAAYIDKEIRAGFAATLADPGLKEYRPQLSAASVPIEVTRVHFTSVPEKNGLLAIVSVVFNRQFQIYELKLIRKPDKPVVRMPSTPFVRPCHRCNKNNHLKARFCQACGVMLGEVINIPRDKCGHAVYYRDIAYPICTPFQTFLGDQVLEQYRPD